MEELKERLDDKELVCPDCYHPMSQHQNLVGCYAIVRSHSSSKNFEGGNDYCYCQRLRVGVESRVKIDKLKILVFLRMTW